MSLEAWSDASLIARHQSSPQEIADLLDIARTDLRDAAIPELSAKRKLASSYNAILSLARAALRAPGFRVSKGTGSHHYYAIQSLRYTVGFEPADIVKIEAIQKKRHVGEYVRAADVSEGMAEDTQAFARSIQSRIRRWLEENHPELLSNP